MITLLFCVSLLFSTQMSAHIIDEQLLALLQKKNYFLLETVMLNEGKKLPSQRKKYYSMHLNNAFGRYEESIKQAKALLLDKTLSDSVRVDILRVQEDNYFKTYQYKNASNALATIFASLPTTIDSTEHADLLNTYTLLNALQDIPRQTVTFKKSSTVKWKKDIAGLMNIPVSIQDSTYDFIFDTGANLSTMSASFAKKIGAKVQELGFDVGGSTGKVTKAYTTVLDSVFIGSIVIRNVVFIVLPDNQLSFPQINYSINAIIGFPVIRDLGEIHISRNGTLTISVNPVINRIHNLALNEFMPIVSVRTDDDTLCMHFDSGANVSELSLSYFLKHKAMVLNNGKSQKVQKGGAGGSISSETYSLNAFKMHIGNHDFVLPQISVLTVSTNPDIDFLDGVIGQDLISQSKEMVMNFNDMYLIFK
jgi:clan AA aspartic protease (TIGR02281 family)